VGGYRPVGRLEFVDQPTERTYTDQGAGDVRDGRQHVLDGALWIWNVTTFGCATNDCMAAVAVAVFKT
jgi:hypothetical protein